MAKLDEAADIEDVNTQAEEEEKLDKIDHDSMELDDHMSDFVLKLVSKKLIKAEVLKFASTKGWSPAYVRKLTSIAIEQLNDVFGDDPEDAIGMWPSIAAFEALGGRFK